MRLLLATGYALFLTAGTLAGPYERVGSFLTLEGEEKIAVLAGTITDETPLNFRTVLARLPQLETVVLASEGGSVTAGLLLADDIHLRGLNTYIPEGFGCYSACAYVYLAGSARQVDGELGVHQFYGGEESAERAQLVTSDILDMLHKFGTPQPVISRMLRTPSDDIYVFSAGEVDELELNRSIKGLRSTAQAVAALPNPVREAMQPPPAAQATALAGPTTSNTSSIRFAIYDGVDFYGADVGKVRVEDIGQCLEACFEERQCKAITLNVNPAFKTGPNCFLKSGTGRGEFYEQAISGVFLAPGEDEFFMVGSKRVLPADVISPDE